MMSPWNIMADHKLQLNPLKFTSTVSYSHKYLLLV